MELHQYVNAMAKCLDEVFLDMTGIASENISAQEVEAPEVRSPLGLVIQYTHKEDPQAVGLFIMDFTDAGAAMELASSIARHMGLPAFEKLDKECLEAVGEFMNTVIGRTVSAWEKLGMPFTFSAPTRLQKAHKEYLAKAKQRSFAVTLHLKDFDLGCSLAFNMSIADKLKPKPKILVVDDSSMVRKIVTDVLSKENYKVITAEDGLRAVKTYKEYKPTLTIMDLVMPRMGGLEAMLSIKEINPDAKLIVLTSSDRTDEVTSAKTIGVLDYILKPLTPEVLVASVKKALEQ